LDKTGREFTELPFAELTAISIETEKERQLAASNQKFKESIRTSFSCTLSLEIWKCWSLEGPCTA